MTAEDAVASLKRWVEICPFKSHLNRLAVQTIDKYTVELKSEEKIGALPALMALRSGHCVVMPKEVCEGFLAENSPVYRY